MPPPVQPKIYHIVHVDRLESIAADGYLWCDAELQDQPRPGTIIGKSDIKERRRTTRLESHEDLRVGDCVPFYFSPRSVMLFVLHKGNMPGLDYRGGQDPIVHLEADLHEVVDWADQNERRWAFTLSNAGSKYFEDRCDLDQLDEIDWNAVNARRWPGCKEEKQAEFLVEQAFPWTLFRRIGVSCLGTRNLAAEALGAADHQPAIAVLPNWYY